MALLATMALLLAARSAVQGGEPCSLNGELKSGACVCDPGWSGAKCSALAVAPSYVLWPQLSDGDPRTHDAPSLSWGGSVLQDKATKRWHGWFNAGCQTPTSFMHTYLTGAVHAVADRPEGRKCSRSLCVFFRSLKAAAAQPSRSWTSVCLASWRTQWPSATARAAC